MGLRLNKKSKSQGLKILEFKKNFNDYYSTKRVSFNIKGSVLHIPQDKKLRKSKIFVKKDDIILKFIYLIIYSNVSCEI